MRSRPVMTQAVRPVDPNRFGRSDALLRNRLEPVGLSFTWSPTLILGLAVLGSMLAALFFAGLTGAVVLAGVLGLGWSSVDRISVVLIRRRNDALLPELALRLARSLRSGLPPERAIEQVAIELDGGHRSFAVVAQQLQAGRPVTESVESWLRKAAGDAEQLLAAGLLLGIEHGGDLASAIDGVGEGLRDDLDLDARRRVLLTQSRMSAAVLVALPVGFALVASGLQGGSIYEGSTGLGLLIGGVLLDLIGVQWMRSLMGGLR